MTNENIKFWRASEKYGCFSNFSKHSISYQGKEYPTSEHLYQALKFNDPVMREKVRLAKTPKESKEIAYSFGISNVRTDWDEVKFEIMVSILELKISQHKSIEDLLMSSGYADIVENSPYDYVWGCGKDGSGKNLLGKAWMEVRRNRRELLMSE